MKLTLLSSLHRQVMAYQRRWGRYPARIVMSGDDEKRFYDEMRAYYGGDPAPLIVGSDRRFRFMNIPIELPGLVEEQLTFTWNGETR